MIPVNFVPSLALKDRRIVFEIRLYGFAKTLSNFG